mmetsp:Transcript_42831/g.71276  ORF Transcript_42831/g.71276 Transcript_42831/m.71276 type:complete len:723 (+) Transcript_42831:3525-5693(+)
MVQQQQQQHQTRAKGSSQPLRTSPSSSALETEIDVFLVLKVATIHTVLQQAVVAIRQSRISASNIPVFQLQRLLSIPVISFLRTYSQRLLSPALKAILAHLTISHSHRLNVSLSSSSSPAEWTEEHVSAVRDAIDKASARARSMSGRNTGGRAPSPSGIESELNTYMDAQRALDLARQEREGISEQEKELQKRVQQYRSALMQYLWMEEDLLALAHRGTSYSNPAAILRVEILRNISSSEEELSALHPVTQEVDRECHAKEQVMLQMMSDEHSLTSRNMYDSIMARRSSSADDQDKIASLLSMCSVILDLEAWRERSPQVLTLEAKHIQLLQRLDSAAKSRSICEVAEKHSGEQLLEAQARSVGLNTQLLELTGDLQTCQDEIISRHQLYMSKVEESRSSMEGVTSIVTNAVSVMTEVRGLLKTVVDVTSDEATDSNPLVRQLHRSAVDLQTKHSDLLARLHAISDSCNSYESESRRTLEHLSSARDAIFQLSKCMSTFPSIQDATSLSLEVFPCTDIVAHHSTYLAEISTPQPSVEQIHSLISHVLPLIEKTVHGLKALALSANRIASTEPTADGEEDEDEGSPSPGLMLRDLGEGEAEGATTHEGSMLNIRGLPHQDSLQGHSVLTPTGGGVGSGPHRRTRVESTGGVGRSGSRTTALKGGQERNIYALAALKRIKSKLEGRDPDPTTKLSIEKHVEWIVQQATNVDNLCVMYEGWTPWI